MVTENRVIVFDPPCRCTKELKQKDIIRLFELSI